MWYLINPLIAILFQQNFASKKKKKKSCLPRESNTGLAIVSSMPCQPGYYSILKYLAIYNNCVVE